MRYTTSLAKAALALVLPFILAHCASLLSERLPLTYDAKSVGGPNSGAPLRLYLPPGNGPFPAVLVMHGCGGITDNHRSWAGRLVGWGYAAVMVDSFGPRNQRRVCERVDLIPLACVRWTPTTPRSICALCPTSRPTGSGSLGSLTVAGRPFGPRSRNKFLSAAAAARFRRQSLITPDARAGRSVEPYATDVLILIGKDDAWTPADRCLKSVAARANQARPPAIKVYPGAVHDFDSGGLPTLSSSGHMIGGNPEAAANSFAMTKAFLDARLKSN